MNKSDNQMTVGQSQEKLKALLVSILTQAKRDDLIKPFQDCFATKGKNKGFLKANKPKGIAEGIYLAIMLQVNPFKASINALFWLSDDQRKAFDDFKAIFDHMPKDGLPAFNVFDKDRTQLAMMGAW